MALCPFARQQILHPENETQPRIAGPTQFIMHTQGNESTVTATGNWFDREDVVVESHFDIANDGAIAQFIDTSRTADANRTANVRAISVETQGNGDVTPWSPAQIKSLIRLAVWAARTHNGIAARQCPTHDAPGFGFHTLFGAPGPWTPVSKTCPGRYRKAQFRETVLPAIIKELSGAVAEYAPAYTGAVGSRDVGLHDVGADVKHVQERLLVSPADGKCGPVTVEFIKAMQLANGLVGADGKPDGIVGKLTFAKLAQPRLDVSVLYEAALDDNAAAKTGVAATHCLLP